MPRRVLRRGAPITQTYLVCTEHPLAISALSQVMLDDVWMILYIVLREANSPQASLKTFTLHHLDILSSLFNVVYEHS
jgi:hypothetical protein